MAKTMDLPGTEGKRDKKLVQLVNAYLPLRDKFVTLRGSMTDARDAVIDRMHELKVKKYHDADEGLTIEVVASKEKLKISNDADD